MDRQSNGMTESMESLDSTGKRKSFRRLLVRFAEKTSLQGVGYINSARLMVAKVAWVVLLLGAIGGMTYHLYFLFDQFLLWPKVTKLTLGFNNLEMPSITICNVNAVKRSKLNTTSVALQEFVAAVDESIRPKRRRRKRFTSGFGGVNLSSFEEDVELASDSGKPPKNTIRAIKNTFQSLYMDNPRHTRVNAGHTLRDMLVSCSFDERDCSASNFSLFQTAEYGNCYTLDSSNFVSTNAGPEYGLVLILYMENNEYIHGVTQGYGARINIHPANSIPFPEDNGIYASTSFETAIGLKLIDITRLGKPYGDCNDGVSFENTYHKTYTRQACLVVCEQNAIIETCNCFSEEKSEIFEMAGLDNVRPCRSNAERRCELEVQDDYAQKTISCSCDSPCTEQDFQKTISNRQWPSEEFAVALEQSICEKPKFAEQCASLETMTTQQLSRNFLKLVIYYESLNYELAEETEEIENAQFLSDVGGALGLWIGLSVLSIFEIFQLIVECCDYGIHRCKKKEAYKKRNREWQSPNNRKKGRSDIYLDKNTRQWQNQGYEGKEYNGFSYGREDERQERESDKSGYQVYRGGRY